MALNIDNVSNEGFPNSAYIVYVGTETSVFIQNVFFDQLDSQITVSLFLLAGLVITTPQGTLVPTETTQSFVTGPHTATTMIVSALHPSNTGKTQAQALVISPC